MTQLKQCTILLVLLCFVTAIHAEAPTSLPAEVAGEIDTAVSKVLEETGVPSASVAIIYHGAGTWTKAYGLARLEPKQSATTSMRYAIGSISKQFAAAAVVMLAEEGKLSLDDKVAKFFPDLTRADDITLRQILSHTAGIRDYWPQDYVPKTMLEPITTEALIDRWARQPLDFEPGTRYQYSNTGYVIAGAIVEKVSGEAFMDFLRERIFVPLGMGSVTDIDQGTLGPGDAAGYRRFALGPPRLAPREGKGWLFAAGELAMTPADLARWDRAMIDGDVPGATVFNELAREVVLANGVGTGYGLGLNVALQDGRRVVGHGGEVSGFTATNIVFPEDGTAIVVLSNQDAANAASTIAEKVAELLFVSASPDDAGMLARTTAIFDDLREGRLDRSLFTPNGNDYFTDAALADIESSLKQLGPPEAIKQVRQGLRGGLTTRVYSADCEKATLEIVTRATNDGKLEQYTISVE